MQCFGNACGGGRRRKGGQGICASDLGAISAAQTKPPHQPLPELQPQQPLPTARQPGKASLPCDKEAAAKQAQADRPRRWGPQKQAEQQQYQANFVAARKRQQVDTPGQPTATADNQDTTPPQPPPQQSEQTQLDQQQPQAEQLGTPANHAPQQGNTPHPQQRGNAETWAPAGSKSLPRACSSYNSGADTTRPEPGPSTRSTPAYHQTTTNAPTPHHAHTPSPQQEPHCPQHKASGNSPDWATTNSYILEPHQPNPQATTFYHDFQHTQPTTPPTQPPHQSPQSMGHEQQPQHMEQPQQQAHQPTAEAAQEQCREAPQEQSRDPAAQEDPEESTFMQRPGQPQPTQAGQHDQAQQPPPQQSQQQTAQPTTANTQGTAKPAAAKSKAKAAARQTCQQSEEPSSSSAARPTATPNNTHIATVLAQQPPFTAMQHGMPLLRDLLAYQVRAHPDNQPTMPTTMAAPPPPPPTLEELQLSLQIAQALTAHIQTITRRILSTNSHPIDNHHQPHPNDVIAIDSQDTQEEADQQPPEQPPRPQPQPQTTKPQTASTAAQQHATHGQHGDVRTQPWWILGHFQPSTAAALQPSMKTNIQQHMHPASKQNTTHPKSHQSTSNHTEAQANSGSHSEQATQPWWILGKPTNRSRSPPRSGQHLDLFHAAVDQQKTQYDNEEEDNLDDDKPTTGPAD